jgi:CRP-like cAMP-binding protein
MAFDLQLLETFRDSTDVVERPAGSVIFSEGDEGDHMFLVLEGEVEISLSGKVVATAGPGEIAGEMALIDSNIRSATVKALTDCRLAVIDYVSFASLIRSVPAFMQHIMKVLADRLQRAYALIGT